MLEAVDVSVSRQGRQLLDKVSLTVRTGEVCAVLGPNGAGKSTLLHIVSGYGKPDAGLVRMADITVHQGLPKALAAHRAVMEQHPAAPAGWTAADLIRTGLYAHPTSAGESAVGEAVTLTCTEDLLPRGLQGLSGGERQRVHLARTLCQLLASRAPERYLLLDEPTAALDFAAADGLMTQLQRIARQYDIGVLVVLHDLNLALRHADTVMLLKAGSSQAFGPATEVMRKDRLEAIYGVALAELISPDARVRAFVPMSGH